MGKGVIKVTANAAALFVVARKSQSTFALQVWVSTGLAASSDWTNTPSIRGHDCQS